MVDTLRSHLVMSCVQEDLPLLVDASVVFEEVVHVSLGVHGGGVVPVEQPPDRNVSPPAVAKVLANNLPRFDLLAVPVTTYDFLPFYAQAFGSPLAPVDGDGLVLACIVQGSHLKPHVGQ